MLQYTGFTPDTTDEEAIRLFKEMWGHPPVRIIRTKGTVILGPIGQRPDPDAVKGRKVASKV